MIYGLRISSNADSYNRLHIRHRHISTRYTEPIQVAQVYAGPVIELVQLAR